MLRRLGMLSVFLIVLAVPSTASAGHGLKAWLKAYYDHPAPSFAPTAPASPVFSSGGPGAQWDLLASIPTGNPHTDIDYFTQGGETFASVGTLAIGPNGGGQTIVQLTKNGQVSPSSPKFVAGHPSATCPSNPNAALGLQHDVEATPKGNALLNATNPSAVKTDAQLIIDATDQRGRCHDSSGFGTETQPRGGLELVDVTDVTKPKEIGLTSHTGESHTVNVDPKRPHIAYSVTSDSVGVAADGTRANENPTSSQRFNLDGFEVVDMSSCMYFPKGMSIIEKRLACKPQVYRYRWSSAEIALGHTEQGLHLRVPRARGVRERPPHLRQRRGPDRVRHERRVRQPRHEDPAGRQAARDSASVPAAGQPLEPALQDGRARHRLRRRHR